MTSAAWRRSTTRLLTVVGLVGAALSLSAPAFAHAALVGTTPANGATLTAAPAEVVLRFNENVRAPSAIVVTGPGGRVSHGSVRVVDNTASIEVRLEPRPADVGRYDLAYRVLSADGHPVTDQLTFDYRPPGVQASSARSDASAATLNSSTGHPTAWIAGGGVAVLVLVAALLGGVRRKRPGRQR